MRIRLTMGDFARLRRAVGSRIEWGKSFVTSGAGFLLVFVIGPFILLSLLTLSTRLSLAQCRSSLGRDFEKLASSTGSHQSIFVAPSGHVMLMSAPVRPPSKYLPAFLTPSRQLCTCRPRKMASCACPWLPYARILASWNGYKNMKRDQIEKFQPRCLKRRMQLKCSFSTAIYATLGAYFASQPVSALAIILSSSTNRQAQILAHRVLAAATSKRHTYVILPPSDWNAESPPSHWDLPLNAVFSHPPPFYNATRDEISSDAISWAQDHWTSSGRASLLGPDGTRADDSDLYGSGGGATGAADVVSVPDGSTMLRRRRRRALFGVAEKVRAGGGNERKKSSSAIELRKQIGLLLSSSVMATKKKARVLVGEFDEVALSMGASLIVMELTQDGVHAEDMLEWALRAMRPSRGGIIAVVDFVKRAAVLDAVLDCAQRVAQNTEVLVTTGRKQAPVAWILVDPMRRDSYLHPPKK